MVVEVVVPGERVGVGVLVYVGAGSDGRQELVRVLGFGACSLMSLVVEEL